MQSRFKISLKENGIHSFERGLEITLAYEKDSDPWLLKEAIMFLHHGIELLFKQVLLENAGEYLIYSDISESTIKKVILAKEQKKSVFNLGKPPHTATFLEVISRTQAFVDKAQLSSKLVAWLKDLNKIRNNIEHYGIDTQSSVLENLLFKLRIPLLEFFHDTIHDFTRQKESKMQILWEQLSDLIISKILSTTNVLRAGAGSIEGILLFKNGTLQVDYISDYETYKKINPDSNLSKKEYDSYWSTGDAIRKALIDGAVRLLIKIDELQRVDISKKYYENKYQLIVDRAELKTFLNTSFEELQSNWGKKFSDQYVYSKKGREDFFAKFGK